MARWNARYAHAVISPNEVERQDGIRHHMWSEEKSIAVPNGIDTGRFLPSDRNSARRALGISREEQLVGVVARLTREKGVDLAIEALARVPGARLVIVGDGPELEALRLQARQSGVAERISFLGLRKSIETVLPAFDVLLIPSRTEAHGLVAAEASACQVPVVAARVGGLSSLVSHDESGLLFPSGDVEAMARLLKELLARRELGRRLGEAGRRHIVAHFSRKVMIERTVEVYEQLRGGVS